MLRINYPNRQDWPALMLRPQKAQKELFTIVEQVFEEVQKTGDVAVKKYSTMFDKVDLDVLAVTRHDLAAAADHISQDLQQAIRVAKHNIEQFHAVQLEKKQVIQTMDGVMCWRESRAIEKVGLYIPGGSAPLFSTVLMLGIPAMIAGCKEIVLCTPPDKNGHINPAILFAAHLVGIEKVFAVGGIQAIAAMALGTASIPKVYKIFGPGNQYVTAAKQMAQNYGAAIDMPAGPSEVLVIADASSNPVFLAADLLSQAEHGADSQVILLSNNATIVESALQEVAKQLEVLPRKDIAAAALENSKAIVLENIDDCIEFSNAYAPEHLILAIEQYHDYTHAIANAGSVFLGNYSCESAGDYASGTNHTLPTNGYAKNTSGVSLDSFIKKITFQEISKEGIQNLGPSIEFMAEAEQLMAHKNAVSVRLNSLI